MYEIEEHTHGQVGIGDATYGPITNITDASSTVVFFGGVENSNTAAGQYDRGMITAYVDSSDIVQLDKG